jgi:hypothetical protein
VIYIVGVANVVFSHNFNLIIHSNYIILHFNMVTYYSMGPTRRLDEPGVLVMVTMRRNGEMGVAKFWEYEETMSYRNYSLSIGGNILTLNSNLQFGEITQLEYDVAIVKWCVSVETFATNRWTHNRVPI